MISLKRKINKSDFFIVEVRDAETEDLTALFFSGKNVYGNLGQMNTPFVSTKEWKDEKTKKPCITIYT